LGAATGEPVRVRLLRPAARILAVRCHARDLDYQEGKDWQLEADGTLLFLPEGSAPRVPAEELYPPKKEGVRERVFPRKGGGFILSSEGAWLPLRTSQVSYEAQADAPWSGPRPVSALALLPRWASRISRRARLRIVLLGDSISAGANASLRIPVAPYLPSWAAQVCAALERQTGAALELVNHALGGADSAWGAKIAPDLLPQAGADLVILAFGMNDRNRHEPAIFASHIRAMIAAAHTQHAETEILLISGMINNPEWQDETRLYAYRDELRRIAAETPGCACVDVTSAHAYLLQHKNYPELSGNAVNHPNDYLIRWYAWWVLGSLLPDGGVA
jgi:lysophospholipase L1-like esterase